jgi:hypothetical protein
VRYFQDSDKLEDWVTDSDYDSNSSQDKKICFAVVMERESKEPDMLKLVLRFNATDTDPDN